MGCSVAGSMAPELVQQVVYLMNTEYQDLEPLISSQVIHPSLSEVLVKAFSRPGASLSSLKKSRERLPSRVQAALSGVASAGGLSLRGPQVLRVKG